MVKARFFARSMLLLVLIGSPLGRLAHAHCDGIDGPVVKAAQQALAAGNPKPVLIWIRKGDEPEIRMAFEQAMTVRTLSPAARKLADTYFFETVVRVHRAGEGVAFSGLKPAGRDLGPAIPAADQALSSGDPAALFRLLDAEMRAGLLDRYRKVQAAQSFRPADVDGGRQYVEAYVRYIHYVERIYEAAASPAVGHYAEDAGNAPKER